MILITYPNVDIRTIRRERYSHPDIAIRRRMTILYCVRHKIGIFLFGIFCYTTFLFFHFPYFYEEVFYDFDYLS
jgi:hypothetical protein